MYFADHLKLVSSGMSLSWIIKDEQNGDVPFSLFVSFVRNGILKGIKIDPEKSNFPDTLTISTGHAHGLNLVWRGTVSIMHQGHWYELFEIKEVARDGESGRLYFHAFVPKEFGGSGEVFDTPVMYQESLAVPAHELTFSDELI
jgi:hypothetical protein